MLVDCFSCKAHCIWVGSDGPADETCRIGYIPRTNADKIRYMSDEELAEFLSGTCPKIHPENRFKDCLLDNTDEWNLTEQECQDCWLKWLKEET